MKKKKHSFLHEVKIATPCPADWNTMSGDERTRFCGQCKLNVYNISEMTTDDAEKLIIEKEGKLCLRIYRRADGTVLTKDCPVGLAAMRKKLMTMCGAATAAVGILAAWIITGKKPEPQPLQCSAGGATFTGNFMTGDMAMPTQGSMVAPVQGEAVMGKIGRMVAPHKSTIRTR
jgi:hypothetical protein